MHVRGSFIFSLQRSLVHRFEKSHRRSRWIVHILPTRILVHRFEKSHRRSRWIVHILPTQGSWSSLREIPPTQSVDCSYSAWTPLRKSCFRNLTTRLADF